MVSLKSYLRPMIKIDILGQKHKSVSTYTTRSHVEGNVIITVHNNTPFDGIDISFEGTSLFLHLSCFLPSANNVESGTTRCSTERPHGQMDACHRFLYMRQPMDEMSYPIPRVLERNHVYTFPFTFVIPDRVLPQTCSHPKSNTQIEHAHTMLPPSLGDQALAMNGKRLLDDISLEICSISYCVKADIFRRPIDNSVSKETFATVSKHLRVIPFGEEEPPLSITGNMHTYRMRTEKDVRGGFGKSKLGQLVAQASQPRPIQLPHPNCETGGTGSTFTKVQLRFDPVDGEQPPALRNVSRNIRVTTFFGVNPWEDYPHATELGWTHIGRGLFTKTIPLSHLCVVPVQWVRHAASKASHGCCDSAQSSPSYESSIDPLPRPSSSFNGSPYYTASIIVPVTLPRDREFVPTFHTCLVSHIYTLYLSVSYQTTRSTNIMAPSVSLKIPIQAILSRA